MTTPAHTPEPWTTNARISDTPAILGGDLKRVTHAINPRGSSENRANAARIVACVNACANIPDPESALRLAVEALESAKKRFSEPVFKCNDNANDEEGCRACGVMVPVYGCSHPLDGQPMRPLVHEDWCPFLKVISALTQLAALTPKEPKENA